MTTLTPHHHASAPPPPGPATPAPTTVASPTRRVIDAPTRAFHWLFALCFVGAYLSADGERWRLLHVTLGYTLAGLLVFRLLYGWVGPRQVKLDLLLGKLRGTGPWLGQWVAAAKARSLQPVNGRQGQHLWMAAAVVATLVLVVPVTLTGYASFNDWGGEWLGEAHEAVGELMLYAVLAHLGALLGLSLWRRTNLATPMLTGRTAGRGPDLVQRNHRWLAVLLLVSACAYWVWEWQQAPQGTIATSQADDDDDDD